MKTTVTKLLLISLFLLSDGNAQAKNLWPKEISLKGGGKVTIYQPQPESLINNVLRSRAAISIKKTKDAEPVFGVIWAEANLETDRVKRMATMSGIKVTDARFPDAARQGQVDSLKALLTKEIPKLKLEISIDELASTLEQNNRASDDRLSTAPPKIVYSDKNALLVIYDGEPIVKKDEKLKVERVVNTPVLIFKSPEDNKYYLYGQKVWYCSKTLKEDWTQAKKLPKTIEHFNGEIKKFEKDKKDTITTPNPIPVVITATEPTELIQSNGPAKFAAVENTGLLYIQNSGSNVFIEVSSQQYYVLLSGRWYKAAALVGPWTYVGADKLPADFAKIPEGSEMGSVLASVAGTDASRDAVMDAQIPQTAKVDRKATTAKAVTYDGEPKFEKIDGTNIDRASNTVSTVMRAEGKYYYCDNGIWFTSTTAKGPWAVSDTRPAGLDSIPPTSPAYNTKYVYVYESTPEVVYVGYTSGYTGTYVYGPTVVYGTGFYYAPWYGAYYYPHPVTYGMAVSYNSYTGWGMAVGFSFGVAIGFGGYYGGCYGPYHHYPPYHGGYGGYHGGNYHGGNNNINIDNSNNFYGDRNGTRPSQQPVRGQGNGGRGNSASQLPANNRPGGSGPGASTQPANNRPGSGPGASQQPANKPGGGAGASQQPANKPGGGAGASQQPANKPGSGGGMDNRPSNSNNMAKPSTGASNNMYSDKAGNVYKQNDKGGFDQRSNGGWNSASPSNSNQMQRDAQNRDRGNTRQNNYQRSSPSRSGGGGGMRGGGGRGGGGRR